MSSVVVSWWRRWRTHFLWWLFAFHVRRCLSAPSRASCCLTGAWCDHGAGAHSTASQAAPSPALLLPTHVWCGESSTAFSCPLHALCLTYFLHACGGATPPLFCVCEVVGPSVAKHANIIRLRAAAPSLRAKVALPRLLVSLRCCLLRSRWCLPLANAAVVAVSAQWAWVTVL